MDDKDIQQPDDLGACLTPAQGHYVTADGIVEQGALIFIEL
jgi:hypothetical protein